MNQMFVEVIEVNEVIVFPSLFLVLLTNHQVNTRILYLILYVEIFYTALFLSIQYYSIRIS